jgi:hypothetical protein
LKKKCKKSAKNIFLTPYIMHDVAEMLTGGGGVKIKIGKNPPIDFYIFF